MTDIAAVQTYMETYSNLVTDAPVWVNHLRKNPTDYNIVTLPGDPIIQMYVAGSSLREFSFAFQSVESTADELQRLENIGFYETLSAWFETQTIAGILPSFDAGKTARLIEALSSGYLFEKGNSETGIYQIQCRAEYHQAKS